MAAYEVLLLNTAVPQIQAAQSGDTYVVPRDIAFSAALTLSAGTANGVPYLNGSKVVTTGSALTFDGAIFNNTGAAPSIRATITGGAVYTALTSDGVYSTGTDLYLFAPAGKFVSLYAGGAEAARITSGGNLNLQKNIGLGGTSATTSGTGITFPATASASSDANTLDDYEEGVYTAVVTPQTSGTVTLNGSIDQLAYTKIGRQVTVTGLIKVSSVASPVGSFAVNLPFAIGTIGSKYGTRVSGSMTLNTIVSGNVADFIIIGNEGNAYFITYLGDSNSVQDDSSQQLQANTDIYISFTYFV